MNRLMLAATFEDRDKARSLAERVGGTLFSDERDDTSHLPFAALVLAVTDNLPGLVDAADVGVCLVHERVIKPRVDIQNNIERLPGVIGLFPMVARADLGHEQADQYWRDVHAPLALSVHLAMSHYRQLSVLHSFSGPAYDGFALCGFDSIEDLRERFFDSPEGQQAIREDTQRFADVRRSPRRLIVTETSFG